jgi:long-chain acyl-CoA synthetase
MTDTMTPSPDHVVPKRLQPPTEAARLAHGLTFGDVLAGHVRLMPARTAQVCGDERWTFAQLDDRVDRLVTVLQEHGVAHEDRIVWLGHNCHRLYETFLAAARIGAMVCPINWRYSPDEVQFVLEDLTPAVVIHESGNFEPWLADIQAELDGTAAWISAEDTGPDSYETLVAGAARASVTSVAQPTDGVVIIYTSAFGGRPGGAMLSHQNFIAQGTVMAALAGIDDSYVYLNCGPMFHLGTLMNTFATFHAGGVNVFVPRSEPEDICRAIDAEKCTGALIFGPTINKIVELNAERRYDLSSLRIPPSENVDWIAMTTPDESPYGKDWSGYGQTEVTGFATYNAFGSPSIGGHGRPSPAATIRIVTVEGGEALVGEAGEIAIRGPIVGNGYFDRDELNAHRFRDGWWHTHDLGRIESDGSLQFVGPATRMIKSAAENIYPAEVEAAIESHDAVKEAAVVGVPDPVWVQSVKAIVVLNEGSQVTEVELQAHCQALLASYKKPKVFVFTDKALPRVGFGKDYDALDAEHGGGNYPGGSTPVPLA